MRRRAVALQQKIGSRALPAVVLALAAATPLGLSGCASINQKFAESASQLPHVGVSPNAPARPAEQMTYPAVHDVPPPRTAVMLTDVEQHKLETDLVAARDQQQISVGVPPASRKKKEPAKTQAAKTEVTRTEATRTEAARSAPAPAQAPAFAPASGGRIY
ncbi:MAG TPA: hypothetical protein VIU42_15155 [Xanthobacteraceae bacterium]|jgi:hypothetical protein